MDDVFIQWKTYYVTIKKTVIDIERSSALISVAQWVGCRPAN